MPKNPSNLQQALAAYDKEAQRVHIETGEHERQEILKRFPLAAWPDLPLERYALGQEDSSDTYCYWMEFGSPHLGSIKGGSAIKLLIYKHKHKLGWYFHSTYRDEQEAWQTVRAAFAQAFELAQAGEWERIDELQVLMGARALRVKTLHTYFPASILPLCSVEHMRHFLMRLGVDQGEMRNWEAVRLNRTLLKMLRAMPELKDWTTNELGRLLYIWADPREARRLVKIAPGENARYWADCLENGYIRVGWDDVGDLREFEDKEAFKTRFTEAYADLYKGHAPSISRKANEVWTLIELELGDIVIANQGTSKVLAIGEVIEPGYRWQPEIGDEYKHTVAVSWDTSYEQDIPPQQKWAFTTVDPISVTFYQQLLNKKGLKKATVPQTEDPIFLKIAQALERKGQAILYGPPGTGKTFYARRFAVWWLLRAQSPERAQKILLDDDKALQAEERKLGTSPVAQRVWWFVANPKEWSWDQLFKDGRVTYRYGRLQRNYPLVSAGDLVVGYQSRPDKRIMALAQVSKGMSEVGGEAPGIELKPLQGISDGPTYEALLQDPVMGLSEPLRNRCQGTLFALTGDEAQYLLELLAENQPDIQKHFTSGEGVGYLTWITFHPSYSYEDFVEGFRPVDTGGGGLALRLEDGLFKRICREAQAHPKQHYLMLIDEINRANLAKVFGELITLLEMDKRGLVVTLPQSKESFTIPPNLYLLGTMNTADRSIKLMDAALRRRFAFLEMMPDLSLLHGARVGELSLEDFLEGLNKRIAQSEGREKQIGHAFLLENGQPLSEPAEFARRFRQEILPLLQEYCYDDYAALENYLGKKLVNKEQQVLNQDVLGDDDLLLAALAQSPNSEE